MWHALMIRQTHTGCWWWARNKRNQVDDTCI